LAIAATGWFLTLFGYIPNAAQSTTALTGIRLLFGPAPALLIGACLPLLIWYPITRAAHQRVLAQLAER